jgi:hypothetical protein
MNKLKNMQMKSQKRNLTSQSRSEIPGPCCLNCEQKKKVEYLITLGNNSGFICKSCYDSNIWAQKEDQEIKSVGSLQFMQNLNR